MRILVVTNSSVTGLKAHSTGTGNLVNYPELVKSWVLEKHLCNYFTKPL